MKRARADESAVASITSVQGPHSDDLDRRVHRYLISMAIRTVCFILVVVIDHPVRWAFAVGAVFLPYIAVILANRSSTPTVVWSAPPTQPPTSFTDAQESDAQENPIIVIRADHPPAA